jgi:hypothetical protein
MTTTESLFIFFATVAILLGGLVIGGMVATAIAWVRSRLVRPVASPRLIMPERYPGCVICEAIDGMGDVRRMVTHQDQEHALGVRW